jgi:hypothetical protein
MSVTAEAIESKLKQELEAEVVTVVDTSSGCARNSRSLLIRWGHCLKIARCGYTDIHLLLLMPIIETRVG